VDYSIKLLKGRVPSNHALAVYLMVGIPVMCMLGMFHGSFTLPLPTSLLTGAVFVGIKCVLHILHLYPTPARQPNEARRHQEAEVVIASCISTFVAWHLGLFVAYTLDASRRRLLEQQMMLRALQAQRVEQLESEKQRIEYDLRFTQRALSRRVDSSAAGGDGLPETVAQKLIADGLMRDTAPSVSSVSTSQYCSHCSRGVGSFSNGDLIVDSVAGRNRVPVDSLQPCGTSTVGSCSEVGDILEPLDDDPDDEGKKQR
jgi:hypothetical protein